MLAVLAIVAQVVATSEGIQLTPTALAVLGGTILPLLVAASTHITSEGKTKVIVNTVLSVLVGIATYVVAHKGSLSWEQVFICISAAFAASGLTNNHLWKQLNVTAIIAVATKYFGLGRDQQLTSTLHEIGVTNTDLKKAITSPVGFRLATEALKQAQTPFEEAVPEAGQPNG